MISRLKPKILFRVDAQPEIGYGHLFRCLAMARMLDEDYNVSFAMGKADESVRLMLSDANYSLILLDSFDYTFPDKRENEEVAFDLSEHIHNFDLVVLDGYWFGSNYQSKLRAYDAKVVLIEDNGSGNYKADVLMNPAEGLSQNNYTIDNKKAQKLLGSKYALLREPFLRAARETQAQDRKDFHVFICFGGSDILNKTLEITKWFIDNTSVNLRIVVGNAYPHIESLQEFALYHSDRMTLLKGLSQDEMVEEMNSASLGVVPASGILLESIACRLPVISGVYAENQNRIYQGLLNQKVFIPALEFKPSDLKSAWDEINKIGLKHILINQIALLDGKSGERIRKAIKSLC